MSLFVKAIVAGSPANGVRIGKVSDLRTIAGSFVASSLKATKDSHNSRYVLEMSCGAKRGIGEGRFTALLSFAKADQFKAVLAAALQDVAEYAGRPAGEFLPTPLWQDEAETIVNMANLGSKIGQIRLGYGSAIPHLTSFPRPGGKVTEDNFHIVIATNHTEIEGLPSQGRAAIKGKGMFDLFLSIPDARNLLAVLNGEAKSLGSEPKIELKEEPEEEPPRCFLIIVLAPPSGPDEDPGTPSGEFN